MPILISTDDFLPIEREGEVRAKRSQLDVAGLGDGKRLAIRNEYERALTFLSPHSVDREVRNCRAVCLLRLQRYREAIAILRTIAVNLQSVSLRNDVPKHIQLNFATALAYGGEPAGALDVIAESKTADDPVAQRIKASIDEWVATMSFLRKLDWKINRIGPKTSPQPPNEPLGRFTWELT